ncbi:MULTISPECIES: oxygenase MpaB family protein [Mycobacteroides]|uniref:oxygenase MpaB family protein n=1 Tax=Mycobacteroides TaxID=670516 RepID=UPI000AB47698|nr:MULTISPECIES: oxygenase MpaB family protein [Mycobacteroides]
MNTPIPTRHPAQPGSVPAAIRAFAVVLGLSKPNQRQWDRLGECLTEGDAPMDRLVAWMAAEGKHTRQLFDRALAEGIDNVPEAPEPLREFFRGVEKRPAWVDDDKLRQGQRAFRMGGADGMYIARDVALLGGYQFSGFNKTLLRTGALEKGSNARFAETLQWALDVIAQDSLRPLGIGYQSTIRVRLIHAFVRRHVSAMPDWRPEEWGLPINQTDMAATLVGALIAPPAGALAMGMVSTPSDMEAMAHLTRYVGWLMGVEEEWLPLSFRDAIRVLFHTLTALSAPDESTKMLAQPMAQDPMAWNYRTLPGLRRRFARAQHLSITSGFLGPKAMRALGLPAYVLPWYPLVRIPFNLARTAVALTLPGGKERTAARGYREQKAMLRTMTGEHEAAIGHSATRVTVAA